MAQLADLSSKGLSERVVLLKISVMLHVPQKFRQLVLKASHDSVAGHKGAKKAYTHILQKSLWPCLKRDVSKCIKTCHTYQVTSKPN